MPQLGKPLPAATIRSVGLVHGKVPGVSCFGVPGEFDDCAVEAAKEKIFAAEHAKSVSGSAPANVLSVAPALSGCCWKRVGSVTERRNEGAVGLCWWLVMA